MTDHEIAGIAIPDYGPAYAGVRERTGALVRAASPEQLAAVAPATPEWTVKDILGHMVGVPTDVLAGRMDGVATDAWTEAQVERYRDVDVETVLAEWDEASATVEPMIADFGVMAGQAVLDVVTHEHDVRHALDAAGARDSDAVLHRQRLGGAVDRSALPPRATGARSASRPTCGRTPSARARPPRRCGPRRSRCCAPPPAAAARRRSRRTNGTARQ